ncbi:Possibl zinc metallo-peptidase [Nocardioides dokdonensis FR1436]|uniref:Possibl zinc metallo-peptidase n=1 Tax=Nocardioides dokdonensis FR1436 TaxID=1300347 RepID=A0A1A9GG31_9ACTN|nr:metallopeptidase family protein [Nocardioides dokdonensis]ANH36602.1 Possibl zinc metallo-peptidase [Nocardioides dokdonensis FR1436]
MPDLPSARGRRRDRRGRGPRGPAVLPAVPGTVAVRTRRERFDDLVLGLVTDLEDRWSDRLGLVEFAVEDTPLVPDDWTPDSVPLAALVRGSGTRPSRLVVFRRPIEHRCETRSDLHALVLTVLVEQVAELLGIDPADVDPRYDPEV